MPAKLTVVAEKVETLAMDIEHLCFYPKIHTVNPKLTLNGVYAWHVYLKCSCYQCAWECLH